MSDLCEIKTQLDSEERVSLIKLLSTSFSHSNVNTSNHFNNFLDYVPNKLFVLYKSNNELVGILCLLERSFNYFGLVLSLTGLTYMAVHPDKRNSSVTKVLKRKMFEHISQSSDLSMGFARKAMDGYWFPYGYVGFTNFGELIIDQNAMPININEVKIRKLEENDLSSITSFFSTTYENVLGALHRSQELWNYYLKKISIDGLKAILVHENGILNGYFIVRQNHIIEVAANENFMKKMLGAIHKFYQDEKLQDKKLIFEIGEMHPLAKHLKCLPHSLHTRHAWNGGHIIRINSIVPFLDKIKIILEKRANNVFIKDFIIDWGGVVFIYKNMKLSINESSSQIFAANNKWNWTKLILGTSNVVELINDKTILPIFTVLFPKNSPQVPHLDQF
jgi:hypothetical protein